MRDQKAKESAQATEEQLAKIKKQGPGSVVQLSGLVSEVSFHLNNMFLNKVNNFSFRSCPSDVTWLMFIIPRWVNPMRVLRRRAKRMSLLATMRLTTKKSISMNMWINVVKHSPIRRREKSE